MRRTRHADNLFHKLYKDARAPRLLREEGRVMSTCRCRPCALWVVESATSRAPSPPCRKMLLPSTLPRAPTRHSASSTASSRDVYVPTSSVCTVSRRISHSRSPSRPCRQLLLSSTQSMARTRPSASLRLTTTSKLVLIPRLVGAPGTW